MRKSVVFLFLPTIFWVTCWCCGSLTHMEVVNRASEFVNVIYKGIDISKLLKKHTDALRAGSVFPDAFYSSACYGGRYHDRSETAHWMKFVLAALDHFTLKYAEKIDLNGERLLVFILGVISHDVADVLWHSLGIDQGFIDTMAKVNFRDNYQCAHTIADPGGDAVILNDFNYADPDIPLKWFVPVTDLIEIFHKIGINFNETTIKTCAVDLMMLEAGGELEIFSELYPIFVAKSSFLGSVRFTDYFLGGLAEMSSWTVQRWRTAFLYLQQNGSNCINTEEGGINPLYWVCGAQPPIAPPAAAENRNAASFSKVQLSKVKYFEWLQIARDKNAAFVHLKVESSNGGLLLLRNFTKSFRNSRRKTVETDANSAEYFVDNSFAMLGQSVAKADLNKDGYEDLIVGAPGYSSENLLHQGRVYVIFGTADGLPHHSSLNLDASASIIIDPPQFDEYLSQRFGYAITVLDFNDDQHIDIAISAPLYSPDEVDALYSGQVYVYFGKATNDVDDIINTTAPDVIMDCGMRFCNFGTFLGSGDVNGDGTEDLIIGSPYASQLYDKISVDSTLSQNGQVAVYFGGSHRQTNATYQDPDLLLWGAEPYSWFGSSALPGLGCDLLIGAPAQQVGNLQMAGAVYCYTKYALLAIFAEGSEEFANFGASLALGYPFDNRRPVLAISAPSENIIGKHFGVIDLPLKQAGSVYIFHRNSTTAYAKLTGNRRFGYFGHFVTFSDVNLDGKEDLIVGNPKRQRYLEPETENPMPGAIFVYFGGQSFPGLNEACRGSVSPCPEQQANDVLYDVENRSQFGSKALLISNGNFVQLLVSAPFSYQHSRQAGKLSLVDVSRKFYSQLSILPVSV